MAETLQLGLKIIVNKDNLQLTLKAGNTQQNISYPLTANLSKQLLQGNISLLANAVNHKLTPYLNDKRGDVNLDVNTAANPWHFTAMAQLQRVFRSCNAEISQSELCRDTLQLAFANLADAQQHVHIQQRLEITEAAIIEQLQQTLSRT